MILTKSFLLEAGMVTAYLLIKLLLVFCVAKLIQRKWAFDRLSSLIAGWLLILALQSGIILAISAAGLLHQSYFLAFALLIVSLIYWRTRSIALESWSVDVSWRSHLPGIAIVVSLFAMWLRSLFFYDYTWDAQTYGLPRLAIWLNYGSVFVHMPTLQLNLFVNEWNAELNGVAYALASGAYLGFGFGNFEVLLMLFVTLAWVAILLGTPVFWALCLSAVLGSAPAMLGLASTIKGDLLACTAFVMAFGWLVYIKRQGSSPQLAFAMLMLAATLAVGSKISVVLPVLAIVAFAIALIGRHGILNLWLFPALTKLGLVACLFIFSSRFWTNWAIYGNPLKRIDVEQARFSFHHMLGNLELAGIRMFGALEEMQGKGPMWALSGSMGWSAWFVAVVVLLTSIGAVMRLVRASSSRHLGQTSELLVPQNDHSADGSFKPHGSKISFRWLTMVGAAVLVTTMVSMTLTEAYPWTFRYFAPGILVLLIATAVCAIRANTFRRKRTIAILAALVVAMNLAITSRPGEVLPAHHLRILAIEVEQANSPLKRISLLLKGPYQAASVEALGLDTDKPLSVLAFKDLETSLIPFLGSHAQNKIQLVADQKALITAVAQSGWDVVAILQKKEVRDQSLVLSLTQLGYWIAVDNAQYVIAFPQSRIVLMPLKGSRELNWSKWNSENGAILNVSNGIPEIASARPIDTGFITQELRFEGPTLIKASFEGEISGPGTHAAHLSIHGKQTIITLPTGSYKSSKVFQGIVPSLAKDSVQRLSFGLGGWAQGSGHLRLTKLEVFRLQTVGGNDSLIGVSRPTEKKPFSTIIALFLGVAVIVGCAMFGRLLLLSCGVTNLSMLGGSLVLGYGVFGLTLLLTLKYFGNPTIGALIFAGLLGAMIGRKRGFSNIFSGQTKADDPISVPTQAQSSSKSTGSGVVDGLIAATLVSWVVAISLSYIPLGWLAVDPKYQFPEIYDLPKHLFVALSLYEAKDWPPNNPFLSSEIFAYNFLFYFPPAFISKLAGNSLTIFQTFPLVMIAIAIALPMTVLDVVRGLTQSRLIHLGAVLLATWIGGLTPLWLKNKPSIGFFLYTEKFLTSQIWVDELFQSVIFVPQHVFAVLCGLLAMFVLANIRFASNDYKQVFLAGIATVAGSLSSLILLPHLLASFAIGLSLMFFLRWRTHGYSAFRDSRPAIVLIGTLLPIGLLVPFLNEILNWSSGTGALTTVPKISTQWFYVMSAMGAVFLLAIFSLIRLLDNRKKDYGTASRGDNMVACMWVMAIVGLIGLLFGGYPDAGIKSGLWLRITLVPLAGVGMLILVTKVAEARTRILGILVVSALFFGIAIVNYPTMRYFVQSAWQPLDPRIRAFISFIRNLPEHSRLALFSTEPVLVALSGRQLDFDFSPVRSDSYMSPEGRRNARKLWDGFLQSSSSEVFSELDRRYDYLIAPVGSRADTRLAEKFAATTRIGGYSVYKTGTSP